MKSGKKTLTALIQQMRLETQICTNCVSLQLPDIWGQGIPPPKSITPRIPDIPKGKGCACVCVCSNSCSAPPRTMNTIQPLDSKTQIYNKHTITLINAYIAREGDLKSARLQNNNSKINKQASEQINKARRWAGKQGSRKECMEFKPEWFHPPCAALLTRSTGACAQGLRLGGTTGCHSRWCRNDIRQTHEAAQRGGEDTHTCVIRHSARTQAASVRETNENAGA